MHMKVWVHLESWGVFSAGKGWPQALQVCCDSNTVKSFQNGCGIHDLIVVQAFLLMFQLRNNLKALLSIPFEIWNTFFKPCPIVYSDSWLQDFSDCLMLKSVGKIENDDILIIQKKAITTFDWEVLKSNVQLSTTTSRKNNFQDRPMCSAHR